MDLKKLYRSINSLSLDVASGAVCSSYFFSIFLGTPIAPVVFVVLFLSVWLLYTTDHLLDAKWMSSGGSTERHRFHHRFFTPIVIIAIVIFICNLVMVWMLPVAVFKAGVVLGILAMVYLYIIRQVPWAKEFVAAALYTAGVLIPVLPDLYLSVTSVGLIIQFYAAALINLLIFSWFDHDRDVEQVAYSFVTSVGKSLTGTFIWSLFILQSGLVLWSGFNLYYTLLWSIGLGHMGIYLGNRYFARTDNFRLAGDALFLLPVLVMAYQ